MYTPPPKPQLIDEEYSEIHSAFARAMFAWNQVDGLLFPIFLAASGRLEGDMRPLRAAFYRVINFNARMDMINAAANETWAKSSRRQQWSEFMTQLKAEARKRNEIAHGVASVYSPQKPNEKYLVVIAPAFWDPSFPGTVGAAKNVGWTLAEIEQSSADWRALGATLNRWTLEIWQEVFVTMLPEKAGDQPFTPTEA